MKVKSKKSVSIIGGAYGPTSVFIAGRGGRQPLKARIQNHVYKCKRKKAEKKIVAGTHTLEEVVAYAMYNYKAVEVSATERQYVEQRKSLKEGLILRNKPELLEALKDISKPDISNEDSIREYFEQLQDRSEMINEIPESEMPMDFHIYKIEMSENYLEMEIDFIWNVFSVSYSGNKQTIKQVKKIAQDLYIYYGVSEDDIREKSERYSSLLMALST